jgi:hypothetical protein
MKKKLAVLFILFAGVLTAGSVSEDIIRKQNKINEKQSQIDEKKKINQIKYKDNKGKLAEKNADLAADQRELDYEKAKLKFMKDNKDLLVKIENKKTEIHYERRKNNTDWAKIEKMTSERNALQDKYRDKELKFETNYSKR